MKKKILFLIIFVLGVSLSSCSFLGLNTHSYNDHDTCDNLVKELTDLLSDKDNDGLKELFAPRLSKNIPSFDEDIQDFIDYYDGEFVSLVGMVTTSERSDFDYEEKNYGMEYSVVTSTDTYNFHIFYVEKDSRNKDDIGIIYLYVLKLSEDEYPEKKYFGDINGSQDGIFVAFPHMLPEE